MEGMQGSQGLHQLRTLGGELGRLGVPWLLTLLGLSGGTIEDLQILPLLWFATPVLLWRLRRALHVAPELVRPWLLAAVAVGVCCWAVAVPASLLGAAEITRSAHWFGTWLGLVLYTTAMARLTRWIRWPAYERRWLQAVRTALLAGGIAALASASMLSVDALDPQESTGVRLLPWVLLIAGLVVEVLALVRAARIHTPTHLGLSSIPPMSGLFAVGMPTDDHRPPPSASGPVQQE